MVATSIVKFLVTTVIAGLLGAGAMETTMWLITRAGLANGQMVVALGSLVTESRQGAKRVGVVLHAAAAVVFSLGYTLILQAAGVATIPAALALGLAIGFVHGMVVSILLVWVVAEHHPLEEFKEADLAIGLCHLAGHVAFGGFVGLVVGFSRL